MINSVTIINHKGDQVLLTLRSPELSGFFIKKIDGLGPPIGTINTSPYATIDGSRYVSSRSSERNILFHLGFLDNPTIEVSRNAAYKFFSVKNELTMIFETDTKTVQIVGWVETNEPEIFTKESGTVVSIICPDPYYRSMLDQIVDFSALQALFQFPYSNEDLTIPLTYFGDVEVAAEQSIDYLGTQPVGFKIIINSTGSAGTINIYNVSTGESMVINNTIITNITGSGISIGDEITITTIKGQKTALLNRNGVNINILNAVIESNDWFTLDIGQNTFYYSAVSGGSYLLFKIEYQLLYEGI